MSTSDELRPLCALAYQRARMIAAVDETAVPAPMRHFLHMAAQTPRSLSVARQVLESDPVFRAEVLSAANEANVGTAGYTWLKRLDSPEAIPTPPAPPQFGADGEPIGALAALRRRAADLEATIEQLEQQVQDLEESQQAKTTHIEALESALIERTQQWRLVLRQLSRAMEQLPEDFHDQIIDLRESADHPSTDRAAEPVKERPAT